MTEREYGIGRVPADVDPLDETMALIEAERLQPSRPRPRPSQEYMVCRRCGQGGYTGEYPFSTVASLRICDDCV